MAITITKNITLQGVIHINEPVSANYEIYLVLPTQNYPNALPNALDNQVLEEIYVINDHANTTRIYLPSISSLKGAWNPKIHVVQNNPTLPTLEVYAYSSETGADTIIGAVAVDILTYRETKYLHPVENNLWMCLTAMGVAP